MLTWINLNPYSPRYLARHHFIFIFGRGKYPGTSQKSSFLNFEQFAYSPAQWQKVRRALLIFCAVIESAITIGHNAKRTINQASDRLRRARKFQYFTFRAFRHYSIKDLTDFFLSFVRSKNPAPGLHFKAPGLTENFRLSCKCCLKEKKIGEWGNSGFKVGNEK